LIAQITKIYDIQKNKIGGWDYYFSLFEKKFVDW